MQTVVQQAYYWGRKKRKDRERVVFLKVIGAAGYRIKITQPDRKVSKIFDTQSKKIKIEREDDKIFGTKISVYLSKNFVVKQKDGDSSEKMYKKGYKLYVQVQPYKKVKGKRMYGKWSSKMRLQMDDGFWFDAY